jgi:iron-sulfur cluster repair protein YtfE (RIC family)
MPKGNVVREAVAMESREQWIFPGMPVLSLLRMRPGALPALERFGIDPWHDSQATLRGAAAAKGADWEALKAALEALPDPADDRDWESATAPELLDHLVDDHRDLQENLLPALQAALARASADGSGAFLYMSAAWPAFTADLAAHMKEEENFLFPRILHYDHCVRHRGSHPDFEGGSVNVFIAIRLLGNEHRQMDALRDFLSGWDENETALASGSEDLLLLLKEFQDRLARHNQLEEGLVYPLARNLEKILYDAAISGRARVSAT